MRIVTLLLVVVFLSACDGRSPVAPSPTAQAPSAGIVGLVIDGSVHDTSTWPCVGCRVEMLDGPLAGMSTLTNSGGRFSFYVAGPVSLPLTLRAAGDGYHPTTRTIESASQTGPRVSVQFELEAVVPSRNLAGTYSLTFNAHSSCTQLPDEARRRTYRVTFTPFSNRPTLFRATPSGSSFLSFRLFAGVSGNFVGFDTDSDLSADGIVEELTSTTSVQIWGWGGAIVMGPVVVVPFWGDVSYCPVAIQKASNGFWRCPVTPVRCSSEEHHLTLTPLP
jgi:hypothetical protein